MSIKGYGRERLEKICGECKLSHFGRKIQNQYDGTIDSGEEEAAGKREGRVKFVRCDECEYLRREKPTGILWCASTKGLDGVLKPGEGCGRGKRKERE